MDIQSIHNFILSILNKDENAIVSHEKIDDALHSAQMGRFTECLPPRTDQAPVPVQQVAYGTTTNAMDYLAPFKKADDFNQDDTPEGLLSLPSDYAHLTGAYVMVYNNKHEKIAHAGVPVLNENQLADRLSSQIITPSCRWPVGTLVYDSGNKLQIYPKQPFAGHYYYFCKPIHPKFAYTTNGRVVTYDEGNSIQLLWDDESINIIIYKALQILGVKLEFPLAIQWGQYKDQKGS